MADTNIVQLSPTPRALGTVPAPATGSPRSSAQQRDSLQALLDMIAGAILTATPTGTVAAFSGAAAPDGWLMCQGQAVSRTTYPALFAVLGTRYGAGDSLTTFNLPDLRGRVAVGAGQGVGLTNRVLAATGGEEAHALTVQELPAHSHTAPSAVNTTAGNYEVPAPRGNGGGYATYDYDNAAPTDRTGGDGSHNNMPPFLALNYIVRI